MKPYGWKRSITQVDGHADCGVCHPDEARANQHKRARSLARREIAEELRAMAHELIPFEPRGINYVGSHQDGNDDGPKPCWFIDHNGEVFLRCLCGVVLGRPTNHTIDADGTVNASVLHKPEDTRYRKASPCQWHTFVRLGDWTDPAMPANSLKIARSKLPL